MRTHPLSMIPSHVRLAVAAAVLSAGAVSSCLRNPAADAATAQALTEIADQLGALQQENAALQQEVDSLRGALARQDSVVRRLANLAGVR